MHKLYSSGYLCRFFFVRRQKGGFAAEHGVPMWGGGLGAYLHGVPLKELDGGEQACEGGGA